MCRRADRDTAPVKSLSPTLQNIYTMHYSAYHTQSRCIIQWIIQHWASSVQNCSPLYFQIIPLAVPGNGDGIFPPIAHLQLFLPPSQWTAAPTIVSMAEPTVVEWDATKDILPPVRKWAQRWLPVPACWYKRIEEIRLNLQIWGKHKAEWFFRKHLYPIDHCTCTIFPCTITNKEENRTVGFRSSWGGGGVERGWGLLVGACPSQFSG